MTIKFAHGKAYVEKMRGGGCFLISITVEEKYRNNGIGKKLMNSVLKKCDRPIYLLCTEELGGEISRLKAFYENFGFIPYKQKRSDGLPYNANMVLY